MVMAVVVVLMRAHFASGKQGTQFVTFRKPLHRLKAARRAGLLEARGLVYQRGDPV